MTAKKNGMVSDVVFLNIRDPRTRAVTYVCVAISIGFAIVSKMNHLVDWVTLLAFGLAVIGVGQQFELLRRQRELLIFQQARLETDISSTLVALFEDLQTYQLEKTTTIHALLASPAFGVLAGPAVFKEFVDLLEKWLRGGGGDHRKLFLHFLDQPGHAALFGKVNGSLRNRIFAIPDDEGGTDSRQVETEEQNLRTLARLVALIECANRLGVLPNATVQCFLYPELTDFRIILANGQDRYLSSVMAFSDKYRGKKGKDVLQHLECMTTFSTHRESFKKAREVLDAHCPPGLSISPLSTEVVALHFELSGSDKVRFSNMVGEAVTSIAGRAN